MARVGASAAAQLRFTAWLLALQARVGGGTATADVVDTLATILAALELVVTHPGCDEGQNEDMRREVRSKVWQETRNAALFEANSQVSKACYKDA